MWVGLYYTNDVTWICRWYKDYEIGVFIRLSHKVALAYNPNFADKNFGVCRVGDFNVPFYFR